jgi:membrane protein DedA with SNARE-associated domain
MDNVFVCLVLALCAMKTSGMFLNYFQGIIYNTRIYERRRKTIKTQHNMCWTALYINKHK